MVNEKIGSKLITVAIYFFLVFLILASVITASNTYNLDNDDLEQIDTDSRIYRQFDPFTTGCSGTANSESLERCEEVDIAQRSNVSCALLTGCTYVENTAWWDECVGTINMPSINNCEDMNQSLCNTYSKEGCSWLTAGTAIEDKMTVRSSFNTFTEMFAFFVGRNTNLGIGLGMQWIISILFFYIPGLYGIYLSVLLVRDLAGFT